MGRFLSPRDPNCTCLLTIKRLNINVDFTLPFTRTHRTACATNQVVMGQLYYQGAHGYPQDFGRAAQYFQDAAAAGDATAMTYV